MSSVSVYFDFVSPYTYLALVQLQSFATKHGVRWQPHPVVYAALLDATGLIGPVEVGIKRRYTFADIRRAAELLGVPLVGPPEHPFRSLEALRTACLFLNRPECLQLVVRLATACWGEGRDLTDVRVLAACVSDIGMDPTGLGEKIRQPAIKARLRDSTELALRAGVFGVPTFQLGEELFWGHDRLVHLAARLRRQISDPLRDLGEILERPRSADRTRTPGREEDS